MKLFFKIVLFIFAMITTDGEVKSSTVVNILRKKTSSSVLPYAYTNTPINKCNPNDWYWHKGTAQLVSFTLNNGIDWITSFKGGINQQMPLLNFTHTTVGALTYTMTSSFMGGMVTNGFTTNMVRGVAAQGGTSTPNFIVSKGGTTFPVPKGATGPIGAQSGKGIQYIGGSGGNGLSSKVSGFRFMDPVTKGKYTYPGGYGSYFNSAGQTINPLNGQTISPSNPWWHIIAK